MKILIVSGFLGAGKTTFIKELIRRSGIRPVILENEYGGNSIDAQELRNTGQDSPKPEILEFMEGCVCCTIKDKFKNSVLTIYSGLDPEYLVVEPTGVGRLSNLLSNLQPILHDNITLLKPVVVLSPRNFRQNMQQWPELYGDQVTHAQTVIFSKGEHADAELLAQTENEIRKRNPNAEIVRTHYSLREDAWWRSLLQLPAKASAIVTAPISEDTIFSQITLNNAQLNHSTQLLMLLEDCLRGELGIVIRAKGTLPVGSEFLRFDLADGLYAITGSPQEINQCVFIGSDLQKEKLCQRLGSSLTAETVSPGIRIALKESNRDSIIERRKIRFPR